MRAPAIFWRVGLFWRRIREAAWAVRRLGPVLRRIAAWRRTPLVCPRTARAELGAETPQRLTWLNSLLAKGPPNWARKALTASPVPEFGAAAIRGTLFEQGRNALSVRVNTEQAEGVSGLSGSTVERASRAERVLVVDDHELFRQTLALVLGQQADFHERAQAASVAEARRVMGKPDGKPHLAVVDLGLGDAPVHQLLGELREAGTAVPALTTGRDARLRDRALRAGADEVHTMTAPIGEIIAAARRLVRR